MIASTIVFCFSALNFGLAFGNGFRPLNLASAVFCLGIGIYLTRMEARHR